MVDTDKHTKQSGGKEHNEDEGTHTHTEHRMYYSYLFFLSQYLGELQDNVTQPTLEFYAALSHKMQKTSTKIHFFQVFENFRKIK